MEVAPESIVRDFIYLDVERMKSVLAQLDRGLLTGTIEASGDDHSGGLNAGLSIPGLGGLGGTRNYLTRNELTETRTLHDFVYATTEAMLIADNAVLHLPDDYAKFDEPANEARARLSGASFFLAKARVSFLDFGYMRHLLANLNDISGALTRVSTHDELNGLFGNQLAKKNQEINKRISEQALDNKFVKDLALIFDTFYKDRLSLRALPFNGIGDFRLTGILRKEMLRETMDEIPHKYGSSPREDWWVFGQLAFIPVSESDNDEPEDLSHSNEMDQALDTVFESMREIEKQYQVSFPEIGITPIAIYRTP